MRYPKVLKVTEKQLELREKYKDKFEVYLISDLKGNPLYAGQGRAYYRADNHLWSSRYKYFGEPTKIAFRIIVATLAEAIDLEEQVIAKFNPPLIELVEVIVIMKIE